MNEPKAEEMKIMHALKLKQTHRRNVRKTTSEKSQIAKIKKDFRAASLVKKIAKKIGNYFSNSDLNLDSWLRMEYRNDFFETRRPRIIDIHRWC